MHPLIGWGQSAQIETDASYYLSLNTELSTTIYELQDEALNLHYDDKLGRSAELLLTLYNWKREVVSKYQLSKIYGSNNFRINLGKVFNAWPIGEIYTFETKDESGQALGLSVRKIEPIQKESPTVKLIVNPLGFSCQESLGNTVEFHGEISGGKAPYLVNWYVLNEQRTDFLYQPRQQRIDSAGSTAVITIEKNPNYYILMRVRDACGNERDQMVYLVCQEKKKRINTLFVEPLLEKNLPQPNRFKP
jgi:hypothetical protein